MNTDERLAIIKARRTSKKPRYTLEQIGFEVGLTRERVRQLCVKNGIVQPDKPERIPSICSNCGDQYESVSGLRRTTLEGTFAHRDRTGHWPRKRRTAKPWVPNERHLRIIALRGEQGMTIAAICKEVGMTTPIVHTTLMRAGLAGSYHPERDAAIIADWQSGLTHATLETKYSLSGARIRLILSAFLGSGHLPVLAKRRGQK